MLTRFRATFSGWWLLAIFALVLALTGCPTVVDDGPAIDGMTIAPDTVSVSATGMTDEFFNVEIIISGFTDEIDAEATRVFIQDPRREATPESVEVQGDTIFVDRIAKSWFQNLEPGTYDIGAEVQTVEDPATGRPAESVTQLDLATVTVTQ